MATCFAYGQTGSGKTHVSILLVGGVEAEKSQNMLPGKYIGSKIIPKPKKVQF